jgi:hypothetical protein
MSVGTHLPHIFLRKGNPTVDGEESANRAANCAPYAGSELAVKEQIAKLDHMELEDVNEAESNKTNDDGESLD